MKSIVIAGVGGQGTLFASLVLGGLALKKGYDVKLSEVHGMAQRGGSVVTYVRIGDRGEEVFSPVIEPGGADVLLAFELLEALRWLPYVKKCDGKVFVNMQKILPMSVIAGAAEYPERIREKIVAQFPGAVFLDAVGLAEHAGSAKAMNTVLLGVLAQTLEFEQAIWLDVIKNTVKPVFREINKKSFLLGYNF
jgi:indolepyruvate ferredoxin oxidoreductase beta subunit